MKRFFSLNKSIYWRPFSGKIERNISREKLNQLIELAKKGNARAQIVVRDKYLRLVNKLTRKAIVKFNLAPEQVPDARSVAEVIFFNCLKNYDLKRKTAFSTYLYTALENSIKPEIIGKYLSVVRIPVRNSRDYSIIANAKKILFNKIGREPSLSEISDFLGKEWPLSRVVSVIGKQRVSFEDIADNVFDSSSDSTIKSYALDLINLHKKKFSERELFVLHSRLALQSKRLTLRQVAKELGISAETVRKIQARAFEKLNLLDKQKMLFKNKASKFKNKSGQF